MAKKGGWFGKLSKIENYILLAGAYNAGKTTLLRKLTDGEITMPVPSMELSDVKSKNLRLVTWNVSGRNPLRPLMCHSYPSVDAIVFVIDSHDCDRFVNYVCEHVQDLLSIDELQDVQLLVLASKQDLPGAMTCQEMRDTLSLSKDQDQRVEIVTTSLVTGQGLPEVRDWIDRQHARRQPQRAVVQPLEKAVPPTLKSTCSRMSSALKQAFGLAKNKLQPFA